MADENPLIASGKDRPIPDLLEADARLSIRPLASFIGAIIAGAAVALFLLSRIFAWIPTDIQRLGILFETLQTAQPTPEIIVFGNSVVMSGIDTRALTEEIPGRPLAWNFASTGQSLIEAYLLSQDLPKSVDTAIYGIFAREGSDTNLLHPHKYNTLFMYGYRPRQETIATIDELFDPSTSSPLKRSSISQVFLSRWAFRQLIDTQLRMFLRSDLSLRESAVDLFHPQRYAIPIDPAVITHRVAERNKVLAITPPEVSTASIELAKRITRDAAKANRRVIFLFPPVHPDLFGQNESALTNAVVEFKKALVGAQGTRVIVAMDVLDKKYFIDDNHPTDEGAEILTRYIANAMNTSR